MLTRFLALTLATLAHAQPLPTNPDLVTGELDNGLRYIVLPHANPPGRASLFLHVSTGSLNETDEQRGLAHYLEHLAFNGSENFPPGSVVPFFESLGLTFGQHQNAFTSFDQTVYQLHLPKADEPTLDKAMTFLADVAGGLSLLPEEIEAERQIILEEKRSSQGGMQRVQEHILENIAPGSLVGARLPIGVEETIAAFDQDLVRDYYERWYTPSNMTLIVVADADPALVVEEVREHFEGGEKTPTPADQDPKVKPQSETRAIVATDPELTGVSIGWMRVEEPRGPRATVERAREDWVESFGTWIFNRRVQRKTAEGEVSWRSASASASDLFNVMRLVEVDANSPDPARWKQMLAELGTELQRARLHGFTQREIDDARTAFIAQLEREVERESTLPGSARAMMLNARVAAGEPIMSAAQALDVARQVLPTISAQEVSAAFAAAFDPAAVTFTLQLPSTEPAPTQDELIALGRAALDVTPQPDAEAERPEALMAAKPAAGELLELAEHAESGVWSGWLANGVRVHYRFMDDRKDQATVAITLAAGQLQESAGSRGITDAAAIAWSTPATRDLTSTNIRDLLTGKKVGVRGGAGLDAMRLVVSGSPADLEHGMQLAHLLLTEPRIEPAAFDRWLGTQRQLIADRDLSVEGAFEEVIAEAIYPASEARLQPLELADLDRLTLEAAQARLDRIVASAPIEVAVVGDVGRERALELVRTYLGSLPPRERIDGNTLDALRNVERPAGPLDASRRIRTETDKAIVLAGFFGADVENIRDTRLLSLASRVLSTRMLKRIREEKALVYGIAANASPGVELPGYGMVMSYSTTDPGKVPALLAEISAVLDEFAAAGPTEDELAVAKLQTANTLDERMRDPSYWQNNLMDADYRGITPQTIIEAPEAYQSFTAEQVKEAFNRYYKPEAVFRISVTPTTVE